MATQVLISNVPQPNRLPDDLTTKADIPAKFCDVFSINACDIQTISDYTFAKITTETAADKTGSVVKMKDHVTKYFVKELAPALRTAINTPLIAV